MRRGAALLLAVGLLVACEREEREFERAPPDGEERDEIVMSSNAPGPGDPAAENTGRAAEFEGNAYHLSEGKRLYDWFNCSGCHANGGGGIGPPLMDDQWTYGSALENIVQTILEGRPNGMPSFRGRIPDQQVWEIAAYVRSLGGFVSNDADPSRNDDLNARPAENRLPEPEPTTGGDVPPANEMPP